MSSLRASLLALLVTFLWSTSWVLIRLGLDQLDPLPFAGMRYGAAGLLLVVLLLRRPQDRRRLGRLDAAQRWDLVLLGVVLYAITQGAQFVSLALLPAATASLVLSFTPAVVAVVAARWIAEPTTGLARVGLVLALLGAIVYLRPDRPEALPIVGLAVATVGLLANAWSSVLGRRINRTRHLSPLAVTAPSMLIGASLLLATGVPLQGIPTLDARGTAIVLWLAVVNTAFAFTLWNRTLRQLTATASAAINNTMLIQIALLAWLLLGESLSLPEVLGLLAVAAGTLLVQLGTAQRIPGRRRDRTG